MNKRVVWNDEEIDEDVLSWFGHVEGIEIDRSTKRVNVGECAVVTQWVAAD